MTILVTGASGQLGSYLVRALRQQEQRVVAWSGAQTGEIFGIPLNPVNLAEKDAVAAAFRESRPCKVFADEWRTPLSMVAAAGGLVTVAGSDYQGLLHLGGPERLSRLEMGQRLAAFLGCDPSVLVPIRRADDASPEPRP